MRSSFVIASFLVVTTAAIDARAQDAAPTAAPTPAPAPAKAERVKILVMDIAAAGLDASTVENITGLSAVILADDRRLDVLSGSDVRQMAALEGEKQAMGCTNDASCLAEVAGAMGAGLIVYGNGGKLGTLLNINLNLFDAAQARSVGRVAVQAKSLEELPEKLRPALQQLVANAIGPADVVAPPASAPSGGSIMPMVLVGGGAVAAVAGVVLVVFGALPAGDISTAETEFKAGDATALARAREVRAEWYDNGLAPGLLVTGALLSVVGVGAAAAGVMMMGGAE